jgi:hypothetical protein
MHYFWSKMSPTIQRFDRCKITIYAGEHGLPHFHVAGPGFRLVVEIGTLRVLEGAGRRAEAREALEWAARNEAALRAAWERLNQRSGT